MHHLYLQYFTRFTERGSRLILAQVANAVICTYTCYWMAKKPTKAEITNTRKGEYETFSTRSHSRFNIYSGRR